MQIIEVQRSKDDLERSRIPLRVSLVANIQPKIDLTHSRVKLSSLVNNMLHCRYEAKNGNSVAHAA